VIAGLTPTRLVALGENQIKTLDDLGDLASDELIELLGELAPGHEEVDAIIMAARAHWFDDEETPETPEPAEDEGPAAGSEPESAVQADEAKGA
jgi:N utilization substance protein A